jgi:hypothetical protein
MFEAIDLDLDKNQESNDDNLNTESNALKNLQENLNKVVSDRLGE